MTRKLTSDEINEELEQQRADAWPTNRHLRGGPDHREFPKRLIGYADAGRKTLAAADTMGVRYYGCSTPKAKQLLREASPQELRDLESRTPGEVNRIILGPSSEWGV